MDKGKKGAAASCRGIDKTKSPFLTKFLIAFLTLSLVVGVATAFADVSDDQAELPTPAEVSQVIASGSQSIPSLKPDLAVAEELPHADLGRDEALDLLEGVFAPQLEAPAGIFDDLDVERFLAPDVAVLAEPEGATTPPGPNAEGGVLAGTVLLDSTVPLRTETPSGEEEVVDLSLEPSEGELQPANPLADVGIPQEIGEGIELPGPGVTIRLADAPANRATTVSEQSVGFVANVATDTDLAIAPTPTGVETFTHLRSPDAPHSQIFHLQLPPGAALDATDNGGATVTDEGEILVSVGAPIAIDAAGESVPASLEVEGANLTLTASPGTAATYPILVDPLFQTYDWAKSKHGENGICSNSFKAESQPQCQNREEWGYELIKSPKSTGTIDQDNRHMKSYGPVPYGTPGLSIFASGSLTAGDRASILYTVPRYFTDNATYGLRPTSSISGMNLTNLDWTVGSGHMSPYVFAGIWDPINSGFINYYSHESLEGHGLHNWTYPYAFSNPSNDNGKVGYVSIQATETQPDAYAMLYVGSASIQLSDTIAPSAGPISTPVWAHQTPAPVSFTAFDSGLGVHSLTATDEAMSPRSWKTAHGCIGVSGSPCPRFWKSSDPGNPQLNYDPAVMPQGFNYLNVKSEDPVGNKSPPLAAIQAKIDHTKPSLVLSGTLTEQAKLGTGLTQYHLKYDAADGDSSAAAAQAPFGTAGTGVGQLQRPMGIALDSAGNSYVVDRECKCVQKYDATGKFTLQFGAPGTGNGQFSDPRGIAVSGEGVWVADYANKQVQLFSTSGSFIRKLSHSFTQPYAVAVGPGNALWVSDTGVHKVYKFTNATGTPIAVRGTKANPSDTGTDLNWPIGLAVSEAGTVWVSNAGVNRITGYDANGKWMGEFGSTGTGNGQLKNPFGLAVAPSTGNILVADEENSRIQEFRPNGEYIRQFGSTGAANNQFSLPRGIALGPDRTLYVAESGNKRIAKWTHASYDPQSGVASTEVKIDGNLVEPKHAPGCATKDCTINREWTLKADDFSAGQHTLEVTATDGVGLATTKSMTIETHGDLTAPTVSITNSITEQASLGTTRPSYKVHAVASDPGGAEERKSGAASLVIKVDGTTVDSTSPGCPAGGCSIARLWTLNSDSYAVGSHSVQVIATDAAGRVTTKSQNFMINRDTTAPEIDTSSGWNTLFNRPEGWVEQKKYVYFPVAKDVNGYGVTSVSFKFDGSQIATKNQTCSNGSCQAEVVGELNMANYDGGAHTAEVIATDGAGNTRKRTWTINVDPEGQVTVGEAEDTLEAVEATSDENLLGPSQEDPEIYGTRSGLGVEQSEGGIATTGGVVPTMVADEPEAGMNLEILPPGSLGGICEESSSPEEEEELGEWIPDAEEAPPSGTPPCETPEVAENSEFQLAPISVKPLATAEAASDLKVVDDAAAIAVNTSTHVDTITRPLYEGALIFKSIRDASAPEIYSWRVELEPGQELKLIDPQHAAVYYEGGRAAFGIAAEPAHDAIGTSVPVSLEISGDDVVTMRVSHKGSSFTYPILGGTGWQGGFTTTVIEGPMDDQEIKEEQERIEQEEREQREAEEGAGEGEEAQVTAVLQHQNFTVIHATFEGPPVAVASATAPDKGIEKWTFAKKFNFRTCYYDGPGPIIPDLKREELLAEAVKECRMRYGWRRLEAKLSVHGWYRGNTKLQGVWVLNGNLDCDKWGMAPPAKVNCRKSPDFWVPKTSKIYLQGDYRFWPGDGPSYLQPLGGKGTSACVSVRGTIQYGEGTDKSEDEVRPARQGDPCPWPWPPPPY